jgi:hypothetical protein
MQTVNNDNVSTAVLAALYLKEGINPPEKRQEKQIGLLSDILSPGQKPGPVMVHEMRHKKKGLRGLAQRIFTPGNVRAKQDQLVKDLEYLAAAKLESAVDSFAHANFPNQAEGAPQYLKQLVVDSLYRAQGATTHDQKYAVMADLSFRVCAGRAPSKDALSQSNASLSEMEEHVGRQVFKLAVKYLSPEERVEMIGDAAKALHDSDLQVGYKVKHALDMLSGELQLRSCRASREPAPRARKLSQRLALGAYSS